MKQDKIENLNICFLTRNPFPFGMAQTNRMISMASGLIQAGCSVKVVCIKPTENHKASLNNTASGNYKNINFIYPSGTTYRGKNVFRRSFLYLSGLILSGLLLIKDNRREKIHFVFMGVTSLFNYCWFYLICKAIGIKFIQERSEYPFIKDKRSLFDKPSLALYLALICKLFDGFIVITHRLEEYFRPHLRRNCPVYLMPILVEPERFAMKQDEPAEKFVAYCGSMQGDKDGVPILIDAFKIFLDEYPGMTLYLIGSTHFDGFSELQRKIDKLVLKKNIVFTGPVLRVIFPNFFPGQLCWYWRVLIINSPKPVSRQSWENTLLPASRLLLHVLEKYPNSSKTRKMHF